MKIEIKYDIDDKVWCIHGNEIKHLPIAKINYWKGKDYLNPVRSGVSYELILTPHREYHGEDRVLKYEAEVFKTKKRSATRLMNKLKTILMKGFGVTCGVLGIVMSIALFCTIFIATTYKIFFD